ncbi:head GIN domain-containing protein [Sinomicrobium sp. M5D2P9]
MKKIVYIIVFLLLSCDSENAGDCFKTAGDTVNREIDVPAFSRILVKEGVQMVLKESAGYSVTIETGKNLVNDVHAEVTEGQLVLSNSTTCNFFRDYDQTIVYVTAPDITEIRSSTQWDIRSDGVLTYPNLRIISENYQSDYQNTGNFYLHLENKSFGLVFNNLSNCYLEGSTGKMNIYLAAGNSRVEAAGFVADEVTLYHRGSNDIIVHPLQHIQGDIYSTGDVISVNRPSQVEITEHYRGKLRFEED